MIRGKIFVRVGWGKSPEGDLLALPREQWKTVASDRLAYTQYLYL